MSPAESGSKYTEISRFEEIEIGETSSRASGVVFFVLCLIPILSTVLYGGVDSGTWVVISLLAGIIALAWLTDAWLGKAFLVDRNSMLLPIAGMIAIGLVQLVPVFSSGLGSDLLPTQYSQPISADPYSTRLFVIRLIVYFVFFAAALTFINTERRLKQLTVIVISLGAITAFFGILQFLAKPEAIYGLRATPNAIPFGPFVNQHHFAAFTELGFGLAVGLMAGKAVKRDKMLLLAVAALMMVVAAVLTGSRGGFLSYAGIAAFILVAIAKLKPREGANGDTSATMQKAALAAAIVISIILVIGIVLFVGGDSSLSRLTGVAGVQADVSSGRIHFWTTAIKIFFDHPILGAGYDAFGVAFTRYDTWNGVFRVEQAHNDYLQTLADAGIAGFVCVAGFIYLLFRKGLRVISLTADPLRSSIAIGAMAGCFGILIHSFFDFPLRTPVNAFLFLLLAAAATVTVRTAEPKRRKSR
ncbi:MAG: O-antigen ligase family protein [Pyrinomonadaceae bacterium]